MAKEPAKMPKLPKALGKCVDLYLKYRADRLAVDKLSAEEKARENFVKEHIIATLPKGDRGVAGSTHMAVTSNEEVYQVEDWSKFYAHIKKTGEFDLLNRALNQAAVKERVEGQVRPTGKRGEGWKPTLPPGIKTFNTVKLSVTKI